MHYSSLLLLVAAVLAGLRSLYAAAPAPGPFPRIEAGMHTAPIRRIGVDAAERWLVTASDDKTARVWEFGSGELQQVLRPPIGNNQEGKLYAVALSPDGEVAAIAGWTKAATDSHNIYLFERATGRMSGRIGGLPNVVRHLTFSPDGERLAAALGGGNGIRVYRTRDWTELGRATDYGSDSYWVDFDRRGRLVSSSYDGYLRLYDADLQPIAKKQAPGGKRPFAVAFSPDSNNIAVGFDDTTAVNVLSGADLTFRYAPDTAGIDNGTLNTVAWSRDGRMLYAGGRYNDWRGHPLVSWSAAGRGPAEARPIAKNTIMHLRPLVLSLTLFHR